VVAGGDDGDGAGSLWCAFEWIAKRDRVHDES
jgi:hypothetical protein